MASLAWHEGTKTAATVSYDSHQCLVIRIIFSYFCSVCFSLRAFPWALFLHIAMQSYIEIGMALYRHLPRFAIVDRSLNRTGDPTP